MLWLWRYILGYLTIRICGEECEKIINRAASKRICIWNLHYKSGAVYGNISVQNFLKLHELKKGIKCKISIIQKYGLVFKLKKHKNRAGLLIGATTFFIILFFLSNFIWIIKVEGNNKISTKEIIASCKKIGIREGISKKKLSSKYDAQRLQLMQEGIAWCSLNLEGSVLTVNISETSDFQKNDHVFPSNLKATIDGKIKKIDVSSGDVQIKIGDTVSKGDLLVSGVIQNMSSTLFVHSDGEIIAETKRVFSAEGKYIQTYTAETGKSINRYTINFFSVNIPLYLGNIKQNYNYTKTVNNLKLFDNLIPIKIACEKYNMTEELTITYDKNTLEQMLYDDIKKQVANFNFLSAVEGEKEIIYTEHGILLKIPYICEENIAHQSEILLNTIN